MSQLVELASTASYYAEAYNTLKRIYQGQQGQAAYDLVTNFLPVSAAG